ncbi:unnamed protein product [Ceutorhynchus assimilis]|uniref:Uncharacterized protein n=1 Tax=Ceutorhynchus assimilis TaxID=467358 RepID=A0A9N9MLA9_9CUCU|nr:unnamed protein product [Ceutorhynchus assimilis]
MQDTLVDNVGCEDVVIIENIEENANIDDLEIEILNQNKLLCTNDESGTTALEKMDIDSPTKTVDIAIPEINIISDILLEPNEFEKNNTTEQPKGTSKHQEKEADDQTRLIDFSELEPQASSHGSPISESATTSAAKPTSIESETTKNNVPFDVPSPFKTILFWPSVEKSEKKGP